MYIAPNTVARVLKNVRLDNTYSDTIYFDSKEKQMAYFAGKTKNGLACPFVLHHERQLWPLSHIKGVRNRCIIYTY